MPDISTELYRRIVAATSLKRRLERVDTAIDFEWFKKLLKIDLPAIYRYTTTFRTGGIQCQGKTVRLQSHAHGRIHTRGGAS
jgi:hypothetical protein